MKTFKLVNEHFFCANEFEDTVGERYGEERSGDEEKGIDIVADRRGSTKSRSEREVNLQDNENTVCSK